MEKKIFISHSSKDNELISLFVKFISSGMDISKSDIFCTSLANAISPGDEFINTIKKNVIVSKCVLFVITKNYLDSKFCIAELGAAWALNQYIIPIIVPPVNYSDLDDTPLKGVQAININKEADLYSLYDNMYKKGVINDLNTSNYKEELTYFLQQLKNIHSDSNKLLNCDTNGYYTTTILEKRTNISAEHGCYRIDGLLKMNVLPIKGETHWILFFTQKFNIKDIPIGTRIRFKPSEIKEIRNFPDLKNTRNIYLSELEIIAND